MLNIGIRFEETNGSWCTRWQEDSGHVYVYSDIVNVYSKKNVGRYSNYNIPGGKLRDNKLNYRSTKV